MSKPVVLVTGGTGFVGTWVLRGLLQDGIRVISLDNRPPGPRWERVLGPLRHGVVPADVSLIDRDALCGLMREHRVTHIVHLAALLTPACQEDPFLGCQVNVLGSTAIFDAARRSGGVDAIAVASSYAIYGDEPASPSAGPSPPPMFYGAFKQAVDLVAEQYWRHFGLRSIAVRPHIAYGPERDQGLTAGPSLACRAAVLGELATIGYTGRAGYDYVEDVARAFIRGAFECPPGASIVDLPSESATPEDFVRHIGNHIPGASDRIIVAGPEIPPNIPPMSRMIASVFPDWHPTALAEGVAKTLDFYRNPGRPG